jgi:hypothetical protein
MVDAGPLVKARETLRVFASSRPSLGELVANRRGRFDRIHAILPSTVVAGEEAELLVQAWDQCERLLDGFDGAVRLSSTDPDADLPARVTFPSESGGVTTEAGLRFHTPGVHYLTLERVGTGERFHANPVVVHDSEPDRRLYWGDIHLHSQLSDGAGSMARGLRYGRDVMGLDVAAYTDHDTMGFFIPPGLQRRRMHRRYVDRMRETTDAFDEAGEFVTLFGYEWTKQPNRGGHVNVYFDGVAESETVLYDSHAPESDTYEKLWDRLREWQEGRDARVLTVPHHPAEGMYPFDFDAVEYDDEMAPLVEVYSQWGSSERPGSDGNRYPLAMGQGEVDEPGHYVQDLLAMGHRVGMNASADYHGPHPGHSLIHTRPHLPSVREWLRDGLGWGNIWRVWDEGSYAGGLHAFEATELTRESVFDAMEERRVYGTTQPDRIVADLRVAGAPVGSEVTVDAPDAAREVSVFVAGTGPLERVTVVKNNEPWRAVVEPSDGGDGPRARRVVERAWTDDAPVTGLSWDDARGTDADVYYLRVHQTDGGAAWAGPTWVATGRPSD